jgi:hypothetical protein
MPYINSQFIYPILIAGSIFLFAKYGGDYFKDAFSYDFASNKAYMEGDASFMDLATPRISILVFWATCILLSILTIVKKYSFIPLMGVTTCLYLLTGMSKSNWLWFLGWLGLGLIIYFLYGYKKSKLATSVSK